MEGVIIERPLNELFHDRRGVILTSRMAISNLLACVFNKSLLSEVNFQIPLHSFNQSQFHTVDIVKWSRLEMFGSHCVFAIQNPD